MRADSEGPILLGRLLGGGPTDPRLLWWVQCPGEIVWVPRGFWHATLNLETTVAFTQNVVTRPAARDVLASLDATPGQEAAARALRAAIGERHRD